MLFIRVAPIFHGELAYISKIAPSKLISAFHRVFQVNNPPFYLGGELAVTASNLTSRKWNGILAVYSDPKFAPAVPHIDVGTETEAGNSDVVWLDEKRLLVASDSGAVDLWTVLDSGRTIENSMSYLEHNDVCSSISLNLTKQQVVSGSWDGRYASYLWHFYFRQGLEV